MADTADMLHDWAIIFKLRQSVNSQRNKQILKELCAQRARIYANVSHNKDAQIENLTKRTHSTHTPTAHTRNVDNWFKANLFL